MAEYGIPYMGSKDKIMLQLGHIFPKADHFYDLFGGGFSVTHYMLQRRYNHYKYFHFNEIRAGICDLIKESFSGEYRYEKFKMPWISAEAFHKEKDIDTFIKIIWSFGNNGKNYLFGLDIAPYKKSMHQCVIFNEFDELSEIVTGLKKWPDKISTTGKRLFIRNRINYFRKTKIPDILKKFLNEKQLQRLERLEQLEQLERLQRLERLGHLERLHFYTGDYRSVPIEKNSVIYCDIPYRGTAEYDGGFNHREFFEWAAAQTEPVYISEYEIKDPRFKLIKEIKTRSNLAGGHPVSAVERIYMGGFYAK